MDTIIISLLGAAIISILIGHSYMKEFYAKFDEINNDFLSELRETTIQIVSDYLKGKC